MATFRNVLTYWTEVKRVVDGEVVQSTCCCADPGVSRRGCAVKSGNKTPCRCACHAGVKRADSVGDES